MNQIEERALARAGSLEVGKELERLRKRRDTAQLELYKPHKGVRRAGCALGKVDQRLFSFSICHLTFAICHLKSS